MHKCNKFIKELRKKYTYNEFKEFFIKNLIQYENFLKNCSDEALDEFLMLIEEVVYKRKSQLEVSQEIEKCASYVSERIKRVMLAYQRHNSITPITEPLTLTLNNVYENSTTKLSLNFSSCMSIVSKRGPDGQNLDLVISNKPEKIEITQKLSTSVALRLAIDIIKAINIPEYDTLQKVMRAYYDGN